MWNKVVSRKRKALIWVVSGPSGSGKTTLCQELLAKKHINLARSVSCTTRSLKKGEKNHRDYNFISKDEFLKRIKRGAFVEWKEVFGNLYGTPKKLVYDSLKNNRDILLCLDVKGAQEIKKKFPDRSVFIFVVPPTEKELIQRTRIRAREDKEEMRKRLAFVKTELSFAKKYDYIIVNDDISQAVKELESIIIAKGLENVLHTN
ncbi:MAG: guanylate kinase [Candidatus Omnitrophica bacterium]|nr:guanylate kinase [Candidatus Omnitrophota bacterium]MDD5351601.1 guanylate kinase [Candidatus Omnitrophota bacterium]MDD5550810.1 guanylate kinase [Candidatus Omnitrophota bacterium]